MNQLFSADAEMLSILLYKVSEQSYSYFKLDFWRSVSDIFRVAAALSPVSTWMGDRLVPRSKSELQLEKFFFLLMMIFFVIWAFSRNFNHIDPLGNDIVQL